MCMIAVKLCVINWFLEVVEVTRGEFVVIVAGSKDRLSITIYHLTLFNFLGSLFSFSLLLVSREDLGLSDQHYFNLLDKKVLCRDLGTFRPVAEFVRKS